MNNRIILSISFIFFISSCFAKEVLKSKFNKNILVDGFTTDWNEQNIYANSDLKLMFSLSNDNENIYLLVKTLDNATQNNIRRNGLECWISTKGKKKDDVGFIFPYFDKNQDMPSFQMIPDSPADLKSGDASLLKYEKRELHPMFNKIYVKGFNCMKDSVLLADSSCIKAIIKQEKNCLVLEFKIPIKNLNPITVGNILAIGIGFKQNNKVSSSFQERPDFDIENNGMGNSRPSGGQFNGDQMPRDPRMNNEIPHNQDNEKLKDRVFWFYTTLSN